MDKYIKTAVEKGEIAMTRKNHRELHGLRVAGLLFCCVFPEKTIYYPAAQAFQVYRQWQEQQKN